MEKIDLSGRKYFIVLHLKDIFYQIKLDYEFTKFSAKRFDIIYIGSGRMDTINQ